MSLQVSSSDEEADDDFSTKMRSSVKYFVINKLACININIKSYSQLECPCILRKGCLTPTMTETTTEMS